MTRRLPRKSLKRPSSSRQIQERVLIVCEGKKTEPKYFNALRREYRGVTVTVKASKGSAPWTVVDQAIKKRENDRAQELEDYDHVWAVFDTENPTNNPHLIKAFKKAAKEGIKVAYSNPCFEFWILLHFKKIGRPFLDYDEVKKELIKHYPDYEKGQDVYSQIKDNTDTAIKNAKAIDTHQHKDKSNPIDRNPSTKVHDLVEYILKTSKAAKKP
ncbi:MAG: RloB family protein [Phycisphaerae bacterium]|nr:RloB family protein [Phycisphaerae bacterium]